MKVRFLLAFGLAALSCARVHHGVQPTKTSAYLGPLFKDFVKVDSCRPALEWVAVRPEALPGMGIPAASVPAQADITYDVIVYTALVNAGIPERGLPVFEKENIAGTSVVVDSTLRPAKRYLWSVRVRVPDGHVGRWSAYDMHNYWFDSHAQNFHYGIVTPEDCGGEQ